MYKDKRKEAEKQEKSRAVEGQLVRLRWPVLASLNRKLDRRLVSTFLGLVMAIRYNKSELAFESPRVFKWQYRLKLLLIAGLAYVFLLSLLAPSLSDLCSWLLRTFCHRTGKRSRETPTPLYRLRFALSLLWLTHPPPFFSHL